MKSLPLGNLSSSGENRVGQYRNNCKCYQELHSREIDILYLHSLLRLHEIQLETGVPSKHLSSTCAFSIAPIFQVVKAVATVAKWNTCNLKHLMSITQPIR